MGLFDYFTDLFSGQSSSDPSRSGQTGTPDGVGPLQPQDENWGIMDYFTDEQLEAMAKQNQNQSMQGYAQAGMQAPPIPQYQADSLQGLMGMVAAGQATNKQASGDYRQKTPMYTNPYIQSLMGG